ncbi:MAG: hypothetical protein QXI93_01805 [Candidatus Methanomethylicia archaeon]
MSFESLKVHFRKVYPSCSNIEIENLVSAIIHDKYWKVHPDRGDMIYVVALTRAKYPFNNGFKARATAVGNVIVSGRAAKFCRRGRILLARNVGDKFFSETVIDWPAFIRIMRLSEDFVYKILIENPPAFLNKRLLSKILKGFVDKSS